MKMTHKRPKWVQGPEYVPRKVIHLNVVRLARDIKAVAKAKEMLDDHDRAKLWDKLSEKVGEEAKRNRSAQAIQSDEYWGDENKNWPGDPNAEPDDEPDEEKYWTEEEQAFSDWEDEMWEKDGFNPFKDWDGNEDGGS
jgi:hypothetical protein